MAEKERARLQVIGSGENLEPPEGAGSRRESSILLAWGGEAEWVTVLVSSTFSTLRKGLSEPAWPPAGCEDVGGTEAASGQT